MLCMYVCVCVGRKNIGEKLIKAGADVNAKDFRGDTPLNIAMGFGSFGIDFADILIKNGADLNAKDGNGNTPLIAAISMS